MWFGNLFGFRSSGGSPRTPRQPPPCRPATRLAVEALEDRAVPAALSVGDLTVREYFQTAEVRVSLDAPSSKTVTVNYRTANGTATAGSDYDATSGKLTFAPGETSKAIPVPVRGDYATEGDETFFVSLSAAKNATIADGSAAVRIIEPRFSATGATAAEGDSGTTAFTFTVTLSRAYDTEVRVDYATVDNFATVADNDYVAAAGTLVFAPGQTTQTFTVAVNGDATAEPPEYFDVYLSATFADGVTYDTRATATIQDDDGWDGGGRYPYDAGGSDGSSGY